MRPLDFISCLLSRAIMYFFPVALLLLLSATLLVEPVLARQAHVLRELFGAGLTPRKTSPLRMTEPWRPKRSPFHQIKECVFVSSEEKLYFYKADSHSEDVCGVYLFTDPDKVIEIHFQHFNVPCENGGLVTFFDGWELGGEFFPALDEQQKSFDQRYYEFCGLETPEKVLVTSQNAGMLHYRVPVKGNGFSFYVKFSKTPTPCNVLVESQEGVYTLRNYGREQNCSLIAVYPAKVKVLALDVGVPSSVPETGTSHQCGQKQIKDLLQIGGSEGLDPSPFVLFQSLCGLDSSPEAEAVVVGCGVTVVRLLSSGHYDNSATFSIGQPDRFDFLESPFLCQT